MQVEENIEIENERGAIRRRPTAYSLQIIQLFN